MDGGWPATIDGGDGLGFGPGGGATGGAPVMASTAVSGSGSSTLSGPSAGGGRQWQFGQVRRADLAPRARARAVAGPVPHLRAAIAPLAPATLQCFGERENEEDFAEADVLTAVRFDATGDFLATGDKGGRVVIFQRAFPGETRRRRGRRRGARGASAAALSQAHGAASAAGSAAASTSAARGAGSLLHSADGEADSDDEDEADGAAVAGVGNAASEYRFYTEFQSHEAEFDYLKSLEIEEKINQIAWLPRANGGLFLLTTNDKTIKLWRAHSKRPKLVAHMNLEASRYGGAAPVASLRVPTVSHGEPTVVCSPRRVFSNAHAYHINSIAANSDGATFLSADDLRINLWSLDNAKLSYNIVDIKPPTLEELTEVITAAEFHPSHCHLLIYSSSRGTIKLGDMRAAALCDKHAKSCVCACTRVRGRTEIPREAASTLHRTARPPAAPHAVFEMTEDATARSYFSEIIASVSDVEFTGDGRYIVSRDYLTVKVRLLRAHRNVSPPTAAMAGTPALPRAPFRCSGVGRGDGAGAGARHPRARAPAR